MYTIHVHVCVVLTCTCTCIDAYALSCTEFRITLIVGGEMSLPL